MNNLSDDALNDLYPVATWSWRDGQGGLFGTEIFANGQVRQKREHPLHDGPNAHKMGAISETQATMFLAHCRAVLNAKSAPNATLTQETPGAKPMNSRSPKARAKKCRVKSHGRP